ncbi:uncharacterized protein LOC133179155 [Saccostrea echinata]|uniref:uncharacterized protein LOC133179155 n=1 Tax=Saccostrea echinata TaxID=191078 RepID=UPI002A8072B1|nr:uncharacterized protein LOC133179155 [Saccostrea echinata]
MFYTCKLIISDLGVDMTDNNLYISADIETEMPQSNPKQNTKENGNDVYAVVNKTKKNENDIPVYAEIRKSQSGKEKTEMNKKQSVKEKNQSGQNVNNSGMVYLEIDFDNMSSNRKTSILGAEESTQYADINAIEHADPLLKSVE